MERRRPADFMRRKRMIRVQLSERESEFVRRTVMEGRYKDANEVVEDMDGEPMRPESQARPELGEGFRSYRVELCRRSVIFRRLTGKGQLPSGAMKRSESSPSRDFSPTNFLNDLVCPGIWEQKFESIRATFFLMDADSDGVRWGPGNSLPESLIFE
jgi:hypothetical protein